MPSARSSRARAWPRPGNPRVRYSNPPFPRTDHSAAVAGERREFLRLLLAVTAIVVVLMVSLDRLAFWLAPRIPFSWEVDIARTLHLDSLPVTMAAGGIDQRGQNAQRIEAVLREHAARIGRALEVPSEMEVRIRYVASPTVNAVATLGGQVVVFSGLLDKIEFEEELDAVLAHEIGHIVHRHMVRHLSRGLSTAAALYVVGIRSSLLNRWLIGDAERLQQLAHTRAAEREADEAAVRAMLSLHGSTEGLAKLFSRFEELEKAGGAALGGEISFLRSHPLPEERRLRAAASPTGGATALTPLASFMRTTAVPTAKPKP